MKFLRNLIRRFFYKPKDKNDGVNLKPNLPVEQDKYLENIINIPSIKNEVVVIQKSEVEYYPVLISSDQEQLLNFNCSIQERRIGVVEEMFFTYVFKEFQSNVFNSIVVEKDGLKYEPDIAIINEEKGIFIDIEIDEPYSLNFNGELICTHVKGSDDLRNTFFKNNGWSVIRFSEKQVVTSPKICINIIKRFILELPTRFDVNDAMWSRENSAEMIKNNYRDTYLLNPISIFNSYGLKSYPTLILEVCGFPASKNKNRFYFTLVNPDPHAGKLKLSIKKEEIVRAYNMSEIREFPDELISMSKLLDFNQCQWFYENLLGSYIKIKPYKINDGWINASTMEIIIKKESMEILRKVRDNMRNY